MLAAISRRSSGYHSSLRVAIESSDVHQSAPILGSVKY